MEIPKQKAIAYAQAAISFLLILCTFLPYLVAKDGDGSVPLSFIGSNFIQDYIDTKFKLLGYLFVAYMMAHAANIFVQAHRSNRGLSAILAIIGFIALIVIHVLLDDTTFFEDGKYGIGFYLIIILLFALLILPSMIESSNGNTNEPGPETDFKTQKEKEIEALKAKLAELEKLQNK